MTQKTFYDLKNNIKTKENYIPRNYQSIGGMWTVDTWKKDNLVVQTYDEGSTTSITFMEDEKPIWKAIDGYSGLKLEHISLDEFNQFITEHFEVSIVNKKKNKP